MASKKVTNRQKSAGNVLAAREAHGAGIAQKIDARLAPFLQPEEELPDFGLVLELLSRDLAARRTAMVQADEAHSGELSDADKPRAERDEAALELYTTLVRTRGVASTVYGEGALRALGFSAPTPKEPVALERFAGEVVLGFQRGTPPPVSGLAWNPSATLAKVAELRESLRARMREVTREAREAQGTLLARDAALDRYDESFRSVTQTLVGLFRLAGEDELAQRIRPSSRRPGQTAVDAGEEAEALDADAHAEGHGEKEAAAPAATG